MRKVLRLTAAVLLAFVLAFGAIRTFSIIPSECDLLSPDNTFLWWLYGCGKSSGGGGGSGAG